MSRADSIRLQISRHEMQLSMLRSRLAFEDDDREGEAHHCQQMLKHLAQRQELQLEISEQSQRCPHG